jgi:tetratricopeptide (TPR) repeat protein
MQKGAEAFREAQENGDQSRYKDAAAYFRLSSRIFPDSTSAYLNEAYSLINAGEQDAAIGPLESFVSRAPIVAANQYTLLGQLYLTNDRAEDAIPVLKDGADRYPNSSDIQSFLLNAYNAAGQTEQAIAAYRSQVERNPDNTLYLYNLGTLLLNEERYDEAILYLKRAVRQDPSNANAQYNHGAAHVNKAVYINDNISMLEDSLSQEALAPANRYRAEKRVDRLGEERHQLFLDAIPPLERALDLTESSSPNRQGICRALVTAYTQTDQREQAREIQECAGYSDQEMDRL